MTRSLIDLSVLIDCFRAEGRFGSNTADRLQDELRLAQMAELRRDIAETISRLEEFKGLVLRLVSDVEAMEVLTGDADKLIRR